MLYKYSMLCWKIHTFFLFTKKTFDVLLVTILTLYMAKLKNKKHNEN